MKRIPRRFFTEEFKREAIKLVTEQHLNAVQAGRQRKVNYLNLFFGRDRRQFINSFEFNRIPVLVLLAFFSCFF